MSTNMLGINSATLRKLWCGPLADLMVKLAGKNGAKVQEELAKFSREEPCWTKEAVGGKNRAAAELSLQCLQFSAEHLLGWERRDWKVIDEERLPEKMGESQLVLSRVRFVPASTSRLAVLERGELRERGYFLLGSQSFTACWENRHRLPRCWRDQGNIYFDGFALQQPFNGDLEPFDFQWCVKMHYGENNWKFTVEKIDGTVRGCRQGDCSVIYC